MTFGRLFGGLGGHLDDLRDALETLEFEVLAGWPQGPPGSEMMWSGEGKTFVPGPSYQLPAVWGLELAGQQSSRQQDRRTRGLVSQQTGGLERPNTGL